MIKIIFIILAVLIIGRLSYDLVRTYNLVQYTVAMMKKTTSFNRAVPNATMKILVLGDSTAVGTGTTHIENSTAGRLASLYPQAEVTNLAVNGLKISGLLKILDSIGTQNHFDIVLIQIGANDIIRLTPMKDIQQGINKVLTRTESLGDKVIILHSGKVGDAKIFPFYLSSLLNQRSYEVRDIYKKEIASLEKKNVEYVDLIDSSADKLLRDNPYYFYSPDLLHLSDQGYGVWFDEIKKHL